jgi:hypothetical protein
MMKQAIRTAIITILIVQVIVLIISASNGWRGYYRATGSWNFVLGALGLVPGLALAFVKENRAIGQGILIGCGIMLVIGLAICTNIP